MSSCPQNKINFNFRVINVTPTPNQIVEHVKVFHCCEHVKMQRRTFHNDISFMEGKYRREPRVCQLRSFMSAAELLSEESGEAKPFLLLIISRD